MTTVTGALALHQSLLVLGKASLPAALQVRTSMLLWQPMLPAKARIAVAALPDDLVHGALKAAIPRAFCPLTS